MCQHEQSKVVRQSSGVSWDYGCPYTLLECRTCGLQFYDRDYRRPHSRVEVTHHRDGSITRVETRFDHHGNQIP